MAQHGWGGRPPASDEEARQRIIDATAACIDRYGVAKTTLSDVATELQVTRQTVYRHFTSISDIVGVVAEQGAARFVDDLVAHLDGVRDARAAVVDGFLFCLRAIPADPRLSLLLELGDEGAFGRRATAAPVLAYGAAMLRRYPVDWAASGVGDDELDGLAEVIMRLLISMLEDPDVAARSDGDVRALLERWVLPALG